MISPFEAPEHSALRAMTPEEFRLAAHAHADWIANYFAHVRDYPVMTNLQPGDLIAALPHQAPESGEPVEQILADFESTIFPSLTLWNHPRFFPWFSVSSTPPSILADMMISAMNVNAMLWKSSPGATELEQVTLNWLRQWLGLADEWFGIIYDTASVGVMQAIGAAREWIDPESRTRGMRGGLTVYVSEQAHNSAEKSAITLGFGQENVRRIPVDAEFRMRVDLLEASIEGDLRAGKRPCCIVASIGATPASSVDPVSAIADIAERYQIWLHVDAAYAGAAAVVPEMRPLFSGVERADSLILNPHKWLYVSIDCSVLYTRRPEIFRRASSLNASYLRIAEDERVVNYNDYGVQLGRRFRALKLWYVFRYYGREGIVEMLRVSLRFAQVLKVMVEADEDFELSAPVPFSLVCFRYRSGDDAFNMRLLDEINASGQAFLSQTKLNGRFVLRFAIGNFQTTEQDVREAWDLIRATAFRLVGAHATVPGGD
ncbi:MAG TPA: pyridoxal-dependent decarboxylase [Bryobacteraceae bacterium]|nr:pyridoxal-dependent decarboxylase [Bryobacteraceae bacterium]